MTSQSHWHRLDMRKKAASPLPRISSALPHPSYSSKHLGDHLRVKEGAECPLFFWDSPSKLKNTVPGAHQQRELKALNYKNAISLLCSTFYVVKH